ncbi:MAG: type II secretion system minor pseudopilin GspI [Porticoccaceae bacterium]|nr:type II secretion system minor pseudopilin GspI [Porticoccaceae bacterium]
MIKHRGFTLLEVMIALVIFSICALVILEQSSLSIRQQAHLENKTLALWVAENALAAQRLKAQWPGTGSNQTQVSMAGRDWVVTQNIEDTPNPQLRKIVIEVTQDNPDNPQVTLSGFLGEH